MMRIPVVVEVVVVVIDEVSNVVLTCILILLS